MSMLRFLFCIRDEHETLMATLDMWKFRVVTLIKENKIIGISFVHKNKYQINQSYQEKGYPYKKSFAESIAI